MRSVWQWLGEACSESDAARVAIAWDEIFPVDQPELRPLTEERLRQIAAVLDPSIPTLPTIAEQACERYITARVAAVTPQQGADELLRTLAARFPLVLVSNGRSETRRRTLARLGWSDYFRAIVVDTEVGYSKPDPRIFRHALDALGCAPTEALFVGDNAVKDIAGAQAVGIPAVWMNPGCLPRPDGIAPDHEIASLDELYAIVEARMSS